MFAPLVRGWVDVPYFSMTQPALSDVHVPSLAKAIRRRKKRKKKLKKHMGPGPHPNGSPQEIHAPRNRGRLREEANRHREAVERRYNTINGLLRDRDTPPDGIPDPEGWASFYDVRVKQEEASLRRHQDAIAALEHLEDWMDGHHLSDAQIDEITSRISQIDVRIESLQTALANSDDPQEFLVGGGLSRFDLRRRDELSALILERGRLENHLYNQQLPGMPEPMIGPPAGMSSTAPQGAKVSEVTNTTGKVKAIVIDPMPEADHSMPESIFEATINIGGIEYDAALVDIGGTGDTVWVRGEIQRDGETIGKFERSWNSNQISNGYGSVHNNEFYMDPSYQGQGIGTSFLAHWEDQLAYAGFGAMEITAADVGRYAWAISGYTWGPDNYNGAPESIMDDLTDKVQRFNRENGRISTDYEDDGSIPRDWATAMEMVEAYTDWGEVPEPYEIAILGAGTEDHFGKEAMMSNGMWNGWKDL